MSHQPTTTLVPLIDAACRLRERAHAPYSRHPVGAALRTTEGVVYTGCNVENASYPLGLCAEAAAVAAMVAGGGGMIADIVIAGPGDRPCLPCGGCRQILYEFAAPKMQVHAVTAGGNVVSHRLGDLLPAAFGPRNLRDPTP